ncbi:MAG: DUF72 domain-containing protein [Pyrinomonadaceae bacterium]|nr:DUF72 domain-containing protein [Pyrinomonadaceae bacterium]
MTIHIGTSGWSYDHWQGVLYPHAVPVGDRLSFYLQHFTTVEVNSSHYHWPRDATFIRWRNLIPDDFLMTVKAPRGLTHAARLFAPERWIARIQRGLACLGAKKGVLLVQLPPQFAYDHARLDYFLRTLPAGLKVAVELRHSSWHCQSVFEMLEQRGAAYCVMSGAHLPCMLRATTSFVYVRLHGPDREHLYGGSYSECDLQWWADRIREWEWLRRDVFVYFNNDGGGNAVRNAARLKQILTL